MVSFRTDPPQLYGNYQLLSVLGLVTSLPSLQIVLTSVLFVDGHGIGERCGNHYDLTREAKLIEG